MKKLVSLILILSSLIFSTPQAFCKPVKQLSQLELRQLQTRVYPVSNEKEVFVAVINTLQDNGFTILNIEENIGYIQARKDFRSRRVDMARMTGYSLLLAYYITLTAITYGTAAYTISIPLTKMHNELSKHMVVVDANANVESFGKQTRVRFVMVEKEFENADGYNFMKASPRKVKRILEPILYQAFFNEIDKSLFYEKI